MIITYKKANALITAITLLFFTIIAKFMSPDFEMFAILYIGGIISISGLLFLTWDMKRIFKYLDIQLKFPEHFTWKFPPALYEVNSIYLLFLTTVGFGIFFIYLLGVKYSILSSFAMGLIVVLPCMGIGLRYKTFNEDSKYLDDEIVRGYDPGAYFLVLLTITLISILSIIHTESFLNRILILLIGLFCYIWIIFPDKFNKILPFDNRTLPGLIIYLGAIIILFEISIKGLMPPEALNILQHNY